MPSPKTSEQIRADFLEFFREKGHEVVPSASLVPHNDPTLLFTNAGMNQFKDVFLGTGTRPYNRAADTQKCLRVSGKHNDLEEVGHDTYHHTLFEMLGNWSFGDYFKKEAIAWAWELLVHRWGLPADRLYATVHEGDQRLGLEPDTEAADYWKSETAINPAHIKYCRSKDNFWMMGDTGPCGPCSEIHIDLRPDEERENVPGIDLVNEDDPRVMEIWNLVFIQYNALGGDKLEPLKDQHVDTGMGFERVVAVLQGKGSNYDTDLFAPILEKIAALSPRVEVRSYEGIAVPTEEERERVRIAMRVIADHIRTIAFATADGASPSNAGRGYVIRRILRRAVRYGYQTLGFREPFLYKLVEPLVGKMGAQFPEIVQGRDFVERIIRAEEDAFLQTLEPGVVFFDKFAAYAKRLAALREAQPSIIESPPSDPSYGNNARMQAAEMLSLRAELRSDRDVMRVLETSYPGVSNPELSAEVDLIRGQVPGDVVFVLHDTYGFPSDLTALMAREQGLGVNEARFEELMNEQRARARAAGKFVVDQSQVDTWDATSDTPEEITFVGYDQLTVEDARILRLRETGSDEAKRYEVVLDRTPFYAESGGQVGDTGVLHIDGESIRILDTRKSAEGAIVHVVEKLPENRSAVVRAEVDEPRRQRIKKHHTATHLLHAVLRSILGTHVQQKGSLVAPDRLRFDFSHYERVLPVQLREIERLVNEAVQRNIPKLEERHVSREEATRRGAMALFGEKYGDYVRVITFDPQFSVELCGGTHVDATGEIGLFRFVSESSVAAGVRRIEAVTGQDALALIHQEIDELERARGQFKSLGRPVDEEIAALTAQTRALEKELQSLRQGRLEAELEGIVAGAAQVGPAKLVVGRVSPTDMETLRTLGETLASRLGQGAVGILGTVDPAGDKVYLVASVADDLLKSTGLKAGNLVGALAKQVGGGGGGRPNLATAGGRQPGNLDAALASAGEVVREMA